MGLKQPVVYRPRSSWAMFFAAATYGGLYGLGAPAGWSLGAAVGVLLIAMLITWSLCPRWGKHTE